MCSLVGNLSLMMLPGMLASTGSRLALAAAGQAGGVRMDMGMGADGANASGGGQCDAAFSQPIHCLDAALAAHSHQTQPAAVVPTPGITALAFNSTSVHALPALLASLYDARMRAAMASLGGNGSIQTIIESLPLPSQTSAAADLVTKATRNFFAAIIILVPFSYTAAAPVASLVRERASGSKQIQFVCGARGLSYWAAVWLWDLMVLLCVVGLMMLVLLNLEAFTGTAERFWASLLLLLLYGLNTMFLASLASFRFSSYSQALIVLISFHLLSGFAFFVCAFVFPQLDNLRLIAMPLRGVIFPLFPAYALTYGMFILSAQELVHQVNELVEAVLSGNSTISESLGGQNVTLDLNSQLEQLGIPTSTSPFDFDALGRLYLFLLVEAVAFALLTLAIQAFSSSARLRMYFEALSARLQGEPPDALGLASSHGPSPLEDLEDEMVRAERAAVDLLMGGAEAAAARHPAAPPAGAPALVLWHLRKQFGGAGGKLAVRDLCVRIESGEVFGFLGTNGAGKSTTFGMLTGAQVPRPTSGALYLRAEGSTY